jgi:fluoroquinolone transport system permease protein
MGNFLKLSLNQTKRIGKDNMMLALSVYPIILALVGRFLVPYLRGAFIHQFDLMDHYPTIVTFLMLANPYIYGALAAFMLLDEREENVLQALRVSPLSLDRYLLAKVSFFILLSLVSGVAIVNIADLMPLNLGIILLVNLILTLGAPFNMILINAFAKNRVEGFAIVKGTGMLIMLPLLVFYIPKQFHVIAALVPGYWPAMALYKSITPQVSAFPVWFYLVGGILYMLLLMILLFKKFYQSLAGR